ncbi:ribonuclease H-like domain-containing protein [Paenibacillus sp. FSL H7-0331]|uniref:ribonuclease H-like domain-containing protein n=1 Tax=Paenibacillus sp. FSL H7-0331 TaxID=1920421 RepID=UPI00096E46D3|nr:ribonuclease H-like domain-containing protein [Paenibacillus sp. FSL H7-0331]OMF19898.1 hypothetical protein BK127_03080 [Paenibacillus sp. FSL H7-0331]
MSGLRDRLLRHKSSGSQAKPAAASDASAPTSEWSVIDAHMEHNEWGSFVMRRRRYDQQAKHGRYALSELLGQSDKLLHLLGAESETSEEQDGLTHEKLLYLDTETTGLGIGTGNVAFMIGIGFYEEEQFVVEQMFIRDPGEELGMLHHLHEKIAKHPYLVTYNGKTFDWPIIKNRYILNRMQLDTPIAGHFDFLYPSRSLWKHTLPSCRLGKVEEERLGVVRKDDVSGALAPVLYFQYLAERKVSIVEGVFIHNELDILSLAGLSIHFARILSGKSNFKDMGLEELYRLGVWLDKLNQQWMSEQALECLAERITVSETVVEQGADDYLLPLAQVYKQQHRYTAARDLWELYVERRKERTTASLDAYVELSMYYEHREKQYELALSYAEQALDKAWRQHSLKRSYGGGGARSTGKRQSTKSLEHGQESGIADLEKRIQRLRQKSARANNQLTKDKKRTIIRSQVVSESNLDLTMDNLI